MHEQKNEKPFPTSHSSTLAGNSPEAGNYDHPEAKLWSVYVSEAEKQDIALAESWKGDMDAILIFAGLFSATVTAFITESYKNLYPDSGDATVALLTQISQQLAIGISSNSSQLHTLPLSPDNAHFSPATSALVCNALWFLSLAFSLTCALAATLVQQWARGYLQATERRPAPYIRARIRSYLHGGLQNFHMTAAVEVIPMLLHISLLLFFAGLVEFLLPVSPIMSQLILIGLAVCTCLYLIITLLPIAFHDCPYCTPFSNTVWYLVQVLSGLGHQAFKAYHRYASSYWDHLEFPDRVWHVVSSMASAREESAVVRSPKRLARDTTALKWTMESLVDESEFEPFVDGIPGFLSGFPDDNVQIMQSLFEHHRLKYRIADLLSTCGSGLVVPALRQKRARTCLTALWSLMAGSLLPETASLSPGLSPGLCRPKFWFPSWYFRHMLPNLQLLYADPTQTKYAISTISVGLWIWFHHLVNDAAKMERDLQEAKPPYQAHIMRSYLVEKITKDFERELPVGLQGTTRAVQMMRNVATELQHVSSDDMVGVVRKFKELLSEAHYSVLTDYLRILLSSPSLPYQPPATLRFFVACLPVDPPSPSIQSQFVTILGHIIQRNVMLAEETHETPRIPSSIIHAILPLVGILDNADRLVKIRDIINNYVGWSQDNWVGKVVLSHVIKKLPVQADSSNHSSPT